MRYYLDVRNQNIIACPFCAGSSYLDTVLPCTPGFINTSLALNEINSVADSTATVYWIVRSPWQRWWTWHRSFVLNPHRDRVFPEQKIRAHTVEEWAEQFKRTLYTSTHTVKNPNAHISTQLAQWQDFRKHYRRFTTRYVRHATINRLLLDLYNIEYTTEWQPAEIPQEINTLFRKTIQNIYREDVDWIKKIRKTQVWYRPNSRLRPALPPKAAKR
jgi:hypothetical protein